MKRMDKQNDRNVQPDQSAPSATPSAAPHPLDGSHFHNVIEEQVYSELPPTPEEQQPRRVRHLPEPEGQQPHPDDPAISVGDA